MNGQWNTVYLPEICEIKTGKHDANHAVNDGKYRFYTCSSEYSRCNTTNFSGESVIVPGNGDIGLVFYYDGEFDAYQRTYVLQNIKIDAKFLYYHMLLHWRTRNINKQFGSTVRYVRMSNFTNYSVSYPPIDIQKLIVTKIEELFSKLDKGVEELNKIKEQLKIYRQAVLKEAFDGKSSYGNFEICEISDLVDDIRIGPFGTMLHKEDYINSGVPVINPQHIKSGAIVNSPSISISHEKALELSSYKLQINDIIMGRRGEMGRVAPVTNNEEGWICGTGSILFRLKPEYDAEFYSKILASPDSVHFLEENATGTTMKNLNEKIVKHIPVPKITRTQQADIMIEVDRKLSVCDKIEQTVNESLQKAENLRQSILKQAFEGNLI